MKFTTIVCSAVLSVFSVLATVYALSGFDLLLFLCFGNVFVKRALLSLMGISAAWLIFWLVAFRPMKFLS